ncbi:hypothetical protein PYW07_008502 [Mythimna separata]|uniref:Uncharacterized protein n=1 Tax=Mythimna separata TaxID=271217 RepID=A0AAD7YDW4_MYTSE|nr:hypothetical protein PYW07_008502 [Mythimna separata]
MRRRLSIERNIPHLLLLIFILNLELSNALKGRWKPGDENARRFPTEKTLQNDHKNSIRTTIQNTRRIQTNGNMPNVRRYPNDRALQSVRRLPNGRTMQNFRRYPIDRALQNVRSFPIDRSPPNYGRVPVDKTLQNNRFPIDLKFPHDRFPTDNRELDRQRPQNYRRTPNDGQAKNDLRERTRRLLDEHKEKMLHSKRMQSDWAVTPHSILRQAETGGEDKPSEEFNSKEFKDKSTPQFEDQGSGWGNFWKSMTMMMENMAGLTPPGGHELITRTCYCIAATYITALHDFKKHYMWRNFYENNLQFEVGYLVAEIVSKYQRMLEIFHMATDYFFKHQNKQYAASTYVLYLYTNVLEMGTVITHLCNMLTELEDKYRFIPVAMSGFTDYHLIKVFDDTESVNLANEVLAYEKRMKKLRKEKIRQQKKLKDKSLFIGMKITTPNRRPRKGHWPYEYGWSIENNWR